MNAERLQQETVSHIRQQKVPSRALRMKDNRDFAVSQAKMVEAIQRQYDDDERMQGKFEPVQRRVENQTGLPDHLKNGIENLSGYSMDNVKVHYNSPKPTQLQAYAYAQGADIHVAPGQEKHLPHEAWHVVQQMQGRVRPTVQMQGMNINDNEHLEREADVMGGKACHDGGQPDFPYPMQFHPMPGVIQGNWWSLLTPAITALVGGGLTAGAAFVPGMAPILSGASGLVDLLRSGYETYKTWTTPRYEIASGSEVTIGGCKGTVDGGELSGNEINFAKKGVATLEISSGHLSATNPIRAEEGFDRFTRGIPPLATAAGGALGAVGSVCDWAGVGKTTLDLLADLSSTGYISGNLGSMDPGCCSDDND